MNYYYDELEWSIIKEDVKLCKELRCDGVSVGVQKIDGTIDDSRLREIVEWAYPMKVTCNRAFDGVPDPFEALNILIDAGCERVLTSGLAASAPEGTKLLKQLVDQAKGRISIMPGAGVRSSNIYQLLLETGAHEFHSSGRMQLKNPMSFLNPKVSDAGSMFIADEIELRKMVDVLNSQRKV